ncbi:LysR family transcriptional regulator [Acrocarpospora pleiomorpha]|uniref:LysR family transcriptional regulator n=1 Tax=Acrocarpospora pleiomorpha TaxID=90975 RepID=A0A5M3XB99_9ACTN|nr:LysR family transcriptional regulator [Acrocarpospora pleiomorpha]
MSKRIAALEHLLGVPLFTRSRHGTALTVDGQAFLPHARTALLAVQAAIQSVRPAGRALRVDVLGRRLASADLVIDFHTRHPDVEIDVIGLSTAQEAVDALLGGSIDATFRYIHDPAALPAAIAHERVYDEPLDLLVGPRHPLAKSPGIRLSDLTDHRIWVPGIVAGSEWGGYYAAMAEEFGLHIDPTGPNFGIEHLMDTITDSATLSTFVGTRTRIVWPTRHDLRRIPVSHPTPVYPWSLARHTINRHPDLVKLRDYLLNLPTPAFRPDSWTPPHARRDQGQARPLL